MGVATQNVKALVRWWRWYLCGIAYRIGDALNTEVEIDADALNGRIMRAVEAEAARDRGGAT